MESIGLVPGVEVRVMDRLADGAIAIGLGRSTQRSVVDRRLASLVYVAPLD